jgi:peptidoglycan DL-endopeptidase CwlO
MAKSNGSGQRRQIGTISPVLRPLTWSALVTATAAAALAGSAFATPAYAEPPLPDAIPDVGARPVPAGAVQLPGIGPATTQPARPAPTLVNDPIAAAAYTKEIQVATLGDQLLQLRQEQKSVTDKLAAAQARLQVARDALTQAREKAETMAAGALKEAAALPPGTFGTDLHALGHLSPINPRSGAELDVTAAQRALEQAKAEEQIANEEARALQASAADVAARFTQLATKHRLAEANLLKLRRDNAAHLQLIDRLQEAYEQQLGANFVGRGSRAGMAAHPSALIAVSYALAQLGDPYVWAAEGPNSFDCSGLTWASYRSAGFELPRVAKDQFYATRARLVSRYDLLPGDLIFFASGPSWTSIHHVGMYIGNGRMVHAPRTGDVVKISTVWWSRFYAATRIFGEVPEPGLPPITSRPPVVVPPASGVSTPPVGHVPTPSPTRTPAPRPSASSPSGTPTSNPTSPTPTPTSPTPTPTSPSPTPTTPSPTDTPTPEPTESSGSPDASPEAVKSTSPEPSDSPSAESSTTDASTEPSTAPTTAGSPSASTGGS